MPRSEMVEYFLQILGGVFDLIGIFVVSAVYQTDRMKPASWSTSSSRATTAAPNSAGDEIYQWREHVEEGGLMAFGSNLAGLSRRMATYVDRILKGARPAELAVEQPTVYELVMNLKTAKALGLTIPPSLLQRADQVIE